MPKSGAVVGSRSAAGKGQTHILRLRLSRANTILSSKAVHTVYVEVIIGTPQKLFESTKTLCCERKGETHAGWARSMSDVVSVGFSLYTSFSPPPTFMNQPLFCPTSKQPLLLSEAVKSIHYSQANAETNGAIELPSPIAG
jgi:hypothetical protein